MIRAVRVATSLDSWSGWVREAVAPSLCTFASMLHLSVPQFLEWLGAEMAPVERCKKSDAGRHLARVAAGGEVVEADASVAARVAVAASSDVADLPPDWRHVP